MCKDTQSPWFSPASLLDGDCPPAAPPGHHHPLLLLAPLARAQLLVHLQPRRSGGKYLHLHKNISCQPRPVGGEDPEVLRHAQRLGLGLVLGHRLAVQLGLELQEAVNQPIGKVTHYINLALTVTPIDNSVV